MLRSLAIDGLAAAVVLLVWYLGFSHYNRRRAGEVLRWIGAACAGHGQMVRVQWATPSRFEVGLGLSSHFFRRSWMTVQLRPREMPLHWLISRWRKQQETLTFCADLDCAPSFNLDVRNHRWWGQTRNRLSARTGEWVLGHPGPFVLTTRSDWERDITVMMDALVASRECDFHNVRFRRSSPHFSATVPLHSLAPGSQTASGLFEVLQELATGASASRF